MIILIILCLPAGLIYLVLKWQEDPAAAERTCMNCGASIPISFNVCPHCGKPVNVYQPTPPQGQQYQPPNTPGQ